MSTASANSAQGLTVLELLQRQKAEKRSSRRTWIGGLIGAFIGFLFGAILGPLFAEINRANHGSTAEGMIGVLTFISCIAVGSLIGYLFARRAVRKQNATMKAKKTPVVALAIFTAALLFATGFTLWPSGAPAPAAAAVTTVDKKDATPSPDPTPTEEECAAEFVQKPVGHGKNQVDDKFHEEYAKATAEAGSQSEGQINVLLARSGQDAQVLAIWAAEFSLLEDSDGWKDLVDGDCLSKEGQKLHAQLEGALTAKGTVITEAMAPANGINSGVHNGVYGVASAAGIYGDLRAIKVTLKDGSVVWILIRCGNVVHMKNPGLPEVPTDNPPPPPVKKCPPGTVGTPPNCNVLKSSNPVDWHYEAEKPKVQAPKGNGTQPEKVETSRPGGGGAVDTPANKPNSETGVTAPDKQDPAPERSDPPADDPAVEDDPPAKSGDPGGF